MCIAGAFNDFPLEAPDFIRGHRSEIIVQRIPRLQLLGVNK